MKRERMVLFLFLSASLLAFSASAAPQAAESQTYILLFKQNAVPVELSASIERAGGQLIKEYKDIGVAIARSSSAAFAQTMRGQQDVQGIAATGNLGIRVGGNVEKIDVNGLPFEAVDSQEPMFEYQWNLNQIRVPEAHTVTMGDSNVLVGILDTGIDDSHPDLTNRVDRSKSVSCLSGAPDPNSSAWYDYYGHGTMVAGIVAAEKNNYGTLGVAPNVRLASVRVGNENGLMFPEAAVCGFMWAAEQHMDVVNNSYFVDPWLFNCRNDAEQRTIWEAVRRAIRYSMQKGVTVVAAVGNDNLDLSHTAIDVISPDDPPGSAVEREVTNACSVIPAEIPGVIGVSGTGLYKQKAYYSSYGVSAVDIAAPGGDSVFQNPDPTWEDWNALPWGMVFVPCPAAFPYCLWGYPGFTIGEGTSFAAPHVTGVAALVISRYGKMPPEKVEAILQRSAAPMDCPPNPYDPAGQGLGGWAYAVCQGQAGHTSFFGSGLVDAYRAVTIGK